MFFSEILGHDDENTQLHYKQFKLHNFSRSWRPETGIENKRLAALQALDDQMPSFARGDAGIRIHETTKRLVEESADIVINTKILRDAGFNPTLVRRYLDFVADALAMGGTASNADAPSIVITSDELDDEDDLTGNSGTEREETSDDTQPQEDEEEGLEDDVTTEAEGEKSVQVDTRPRFSAPVRSDDGDWTIRFEYKGQRYAWSGAADSISSAMKSAWFAYFPEN